MRRAISFVLTLTRGSVVLGEGARGSSELFC